MIEARRVASVVLAAGASSRFGSPKTLALLGGRPLLQRVLDTVASAGFGDVVVVLGHAADRIERELQWPANVWAAVNPDPDAGLSSSLRVGLLAVRSDMEAVLVLLGDQPLLDPSVIDRLLAAYSSKGPPVVVPRYADGGGPNPVLVGRPGWALAQEASGDRGLGPVLRSHPELVREIEVPGSNPDIDTPEDLSALETRFPQTVQRRAANSRVANAKRR